MPNFNDYLAQIRADNNVEGEFDCQQCDGFAEGAKYDHIKHTLTWYCPDGHKSMIEKFVL